MRTRPVITSELTTDEAILIECLIKGRFHLPPCKNCSDDLKDFMVPENFLSDTARVYCVSCGKWSGSELDSRIMFDFLEAFTSEAHPAHSAVTELSTPDLASDKPQDQELNAFARVMSNRWERDIRMWFNSSNGLPKAIFAMKPYQRDTEVALYDFVLMRLLSTVVNQAVLERIGRIPEFDYDSPHMCTNCGAPPSAREMRNFNEISRYADIHCGACGVFIRTWDPN